MRIAAITIMMTKTRDEFAAMLLEKLTRERESGLTTPDCPKTAGVICEEWLQKFPECYKHIVDVRLAIHALRCAGHLIGSSINGYCLCLTVAEYIETNKHMLSRIEAAAAAYYSPLKKHRQEQTLSLFNQGEI